MDSSILVDAHSKLSCKVLISGWLGNVVMSFIGECADLPIEKGYLKRPPWAQKSICRQTDNPTYKHWTLLSAISVGGQHCTPALLELQTEHWY